MIMRGKRTPLLGYDSGAFAIGVWFRPGLADEEAPSSSPTTQSTSHPNTLSSSSSSTPSTWRAHTSHFIPYPPSSNLASRPCKVPKQRSKESLGRRRRRVFFIQPNKPLQRVPLSSSSSSIQPTISSYSSARIESSPHSPIPSLTPLFFFPSDRTVQDGLVSKQPR